VIEFKADGSGSMTINYNVDLQTMQTIQTMMGGFLKGKDDKKKFSIPFSFKKEDIEKQFKAEGVKIEKLKISDKKKGEATFRYVEIVISFTHADKLKAIKYFKQQPIVFSKVTKDGRTTFSFERTVGIDIHKLPLGKKKDNQKRPDRHAIEGIFTFIEPVLEGKTFKTSVVLPHSISKSNSKAKVKPKQKNRSSWSFPLKGLARKPQKLTAEALAPVVTTENSARKEEAKKDQKDKK